MVKVIIERQKIKEARGLNKIIGLMFKTSYTPALSFKFNKPVYYPIHSFFVFFPFTAEWILENGYKEYKIVYPFMSNIKPSKPFIELREYPLVDVRRLE